MLTYRFVPFHIGTITCYSSAIVFEYVLYFSLKFSFRGLLTSVKHCADFVHTSGNQEALQKCFRSLEYIFKFIIQSRLLFARATDGQYEKKFRDDLNSLFEALNIMLSKNNTSILNIQIAVLHGSSAVFEQLTQVLPTVEATRLAAAMLEALPNVRDLPPMLTQAKLTAIKNLVTSQLFYDDGKLCVCLGIELPIIL